MLITISMITEALPNCELLNVIIDKRDKVSTIRILTANEPMQEGILYLSQAPAEDAVKCQTVRGSSFYALTDIFFLLNQIMMAFDHYSNWQQQFSKAVGEGCTLTELLNLSYPVIRHPLSILDANEWEIAHSDYFSNEEFDADWTDLMLKHTSNTSKISAFNQRYYRYFNLKYVYRIPGDIFGSGYACNLFHGQTFCGVMLLAEPTQLERATQGEWDAM